jgi:hypothetical protein
LAQVKSPRPASKDLREFERLSIPAHCGEEFLGHVFALEEA